MNQTLDIKKIINTIERLERRIAERFPDSGLLNVAGQLHVFADDIGPRTEFMRKPQMFLRWIAILIVSAALVAIVWALTQVSFTIGLSQLDSMVSFTDAALNAIVVIGAALFFLFTIETRIKRKRALDGLHQLRSITHVIDMHQLAKEPAGITVLETTPSSPIRDLTPFQLSRYLDYCSELLSLTAKLAAVYGQSMLDREVLAAVSEIESLTTNLSNKIWQKISELPSASDRDLNR